MATLRNTALSVLRLTGFAEIAAATRASLTQPRTSHHMHVDLLKHDLSGTLVQFLPYPVTVAGCS